MTDLAFIELPEVGADLSAGDACGVVESVKTASDLYAPVSGEVTEINDALESEPGTVNEDPYGDGWFYRIRLGNADEIEDLLPKTTPSRSTSDPHLARKPLRTASTLEREPKIVRVRCIFVALFPRLGHDFWQRAFWVALWMS